MQKNIKILSITVLSILLLSCGYKRADQKNAKIIYIQKINITGEQRVAYTFKNNILLISDKNSENKYNIDLIVQKEKGNKIKDKTGKVIRHSLSLSANLKLTSIDGNDVIERFFEQKTDYDVATIHSDTINNENNSTKNMSQIISENIINFITLAMRNK